MSIKLKGPNRVSSVNVGGQQFDADKKGYFTFPDDAPIGDLAAFGFDVSSSEVDDTPASAPAPAPDPEPAAAPAPAAQ